MALDRKSRRVGSSCSDSDFWALGHVGNCRVSSIVNLQCHFIWLLQCVVGFWGLSPPDPLIFKGIIYICLPLVSFIYFMSIIYLPHLFYIYVIVSLFHKSTYLRLFSFLYDTTECFEIHKQILGPYRNFSVSSFCSNSDFWSLGHVGNSRASSIVNLQCHLTQGINTYHI